jgi:D-alanine-D-alanine ligase
VKKTKVIILFGGRSAEHEVSLLSARNVFLALDREQFVPLLVGIDKQGRWRVEPEATLLNASGDPRLLGLAEGCEELTVPTHPISSSSMELSGIGPDDVVFPVLHGTYGEDGTVQGLLELADLAYVGPGHLGSAIGMDKDVTKRLLAQAGIPVVPSRTITTFALVRDEARTLTQAAELGFPLFVKPANAGSSVGVSRAKNEAELREALHLAGLYDTKILVEAAVDAREIECAVLGNDEPLASIPAEIIVHHPDGFYSYDAKYVDAEGAEARIPAELAPPLTARVRQLAIDTFRTLELSGMARVDFFLDRGNEELYVNEVNTIPGFTAISMYPKLWEASGVPIRELVTRLIELGRERRATRRALRTQI